MGKPIHHVLGRREREVMDVVFRRGEATVADVVAEVGESVYDSVRVTLRNLEKKGYLTHRREGQHYVYRPTIRRETARRSAMTHLLRTFFDDSPSSAILAFLEMGETRLSDDELDAIAARVEEAARAEEEARIDEAARIDEGARIDDPARIGEAGVHGVREGMDDPAGIDDGARTDPRSGGDR